MGGHFSKRQAGCTADRKFAREIAQYCQRCKRVNIKCWLTIARLGQFINWAVPRNLAQIAVENFIRLLEQISRHRKLLREITSHSNPLCALTSKKQCDFFGHNAGTVNKLCLGSRADFCCTGA